MHGFRPLAALILTAALGVFNMAWPCAAHAQQVQLSHLDAEMAGPRAQVLVLGTVHLAEHTDRINPATLEPLLDRLVAFKPDVITIEAMRGEDCDRMALYPDTYDPESISRFCGSTDLARTATGLDVPEAIAEVNRVAGDWPQRPTPADRRQLAALFLAAGDRASALTQWLQLPPAKRHAGDGLDHALVELLERARVTPSEHYQIAAVVAARLGLLRVLPADDHTGDALELPVAEYAAYGEALGSAWASTADRSAPLNDRVDALESEGDILGLYRYINRPDVLQARVEADFAAALRDPSPRHYGQRYVAGWETRNLRMVANIREAFRDHPGARVLSIVGSTHKPWFDSLLRQMQGVDVVDVDAVLVEDRHR